MLAVVISCWQKREEKGKNRENGVPVPSLKIEVGVGSRNVSTPTCYFAHSLSRGKGGIDIGGWVPRSGSKRGLSTRHVNSRLLSRAVSFTKIQLSFCVGIYVHHFFTLPSEQIDLLNMLPSLQYWIYYCLGTDIVVVGLVARTASAYCMPLLLRQTPGYSGQLKRRRRDHQHSVELTPSYLGDCIQRSALNLGNRFSERNIVEEGMFPSSWPLAKLETMP